MIPHPTPEPRRPEPRGHFLLRACLLSLLLGAVPAAAQEGPVDRAALARDLKREIDLRLIAAMRGLRAELHRLVDERLEEGTWPPADVFARPEAPEVPSRELAGRIAALEERLQVLRRRLGPDHPTLRSLEAEVRRLRHAARSPRESAPPRPRLGLGAVPCPGGLRVVSVAAGTAAAASGLRPGDRIAGTLEGDGEPGRLRPLASLEELEARWRLTARSALRIAVGRGEGEAPETVVVRLAAPHRHAAAELPDTRGMIDEALKRALRQVVPPAGGMMPVAPAESGEPGGRRRDR